MEELRKIQHLDRLVLVEDGSMSSSAILSLNKPSSGKKMGNPFFPSKVVPVDCLPNSKGYVLLVLLERVRSDDMQKFGIYSKSFAAELGLRTKGSASRKAYERDSRLRLKQGDRRWVPTSVWDRGAFSQQRCDAGAGAGLNSLLRNAASYEHFQTTDVLRGCVGTFNNLTNVASEYGLRRHVEEDYRRQMIEHRQWLAKEEERRLMEEMHLREVQEEDGFRWVHNEQMKRIQEEEWRRRIEEEQMRKFQEKQMRELHKEEERIKQIQEERVREIEEERLRKVQEERVRQIQEEEEWIRQIKKKRTREIQGEEEQMRQVQEECMRKMQEEEWMRRMREIQEEERMRRIQEERMIQIQEEEEKQGIRQIQKKQMREIQAEEEQMRQVQKERVRQIQEEEWMKRMREIHEEERLQQHQEERMRQIHEVECMRQIQEEEYRRNEEAEWRRQVSEADWRGRMKGEPKKIKEEEWRRQIQVDEERKQIQKEEQRRIKEEEWRRKMQREHQMRPVIEEKYSEKVLEEEQLRRPVKEKIERELVRGSVVRSRNDLVHDVIADSLRAAAIPQLSADAAQKVKHLVAEAIRTVGAMEQGERPGGGQNREVGGISREDKTVSRFGTSDKEMSQSRHMEEEYLQYIREVESVYDHSHDMSGGAVGRYGSQQNDLKALHQAVGIKSSEKFPSLLDLKLKHLKFKVESSYSAVLHSEDRGHDTNQWQRTVSIVQKEFDSQAGRDRPTDRSFFNHGNLARDLVRRDEKSTFSSVAKNTANIYLRRSDVYQETQRSSVRRDRMDIRVASNRNVIDRPEHSWKDRHSTVSGRPSTRPWLDSN